MARRLRPLLGQALTLSVAAICAAGCGAALAPRPAARTALADGAAAGGSTSRPVALGGAPMILARCPDGSGGGAPGGVPSAGGSVRPLAPGAAPSGPATPEPLRKPPAASAAPTARATPAVTPIAVSQGTLNRVGSAELGGASAGVRVAWCAPAAGRCPPGYRVVYPKTLPGSKPRSLIPDIAVCSLPAAGAPTARVGG